MSPKTALDTVFDEQNYLDMHPDVAAAVATGHERSGRHHFVRRGHLEGRKLAGFDPEYYLQSYRLAAEDIAAGRAPNPITHYLRIGFARGYLARPQAPRPDNAAALNNRFGGFWYDQPNALDLVEGRLEIGHINATQAELLRNWINNGYVILQDAIDPGVLDAAAAEFDKAYRGEMSGLLFECQEVTKSRAAQPWQPEMNEVPAKALDLHHWSKPIRELIFDQKISEFLGLLFETPVFASQSLGFYLGSAQEGHQDSAYVAYSIPRQFCATWIALEDVTPGGGELFYYPGSHRLPDFLYAGKFKSFHEAIRLGVEGAPAGEVRRHVNSLQEMARVFGLKKELLLAKKGDVLFWHADLVHGGSPVSRAATRKSVVTHYCPKYVSPLYAENRKIAVHHHGPHVFSSSYYRGEPAA